MGKELRAVFVNHIHPDRKHVSALRMKSFANSMANSANKIVLLCETQNPTDAVKTVSQVGDELASHDWSQPYILACRPEPTWLLRRAREGNLVSGLRQGVLASSYLFRSGVYSDWLRGTLPYFPLLSQTFRPDIVWGTFGNTDAWNIARRLAALSGCSWVADMKDNWSAFMPTGLVRIMAGRYRDAAHMTVFSESHRLETDRWFGHDKTVIYSGFNEDEKAPVEDQTGPFRILLTGSIYNEYFLKLYIRGLSTWLKASHQSGLKRNVVFSYAGNDVEIVARQVDVLQDLCEISVHEFLPYEELLALQKTSCLNVYINNSRNLFQHKVLELLAAGRPIISVPGEGQEATSIAVRVGGCLLSGETEEQIFQALQKVFSQTLPTTDLNKINAYSWSSQATKLSELFRQLVGDKP